MIFSALIPVIVCILGLGTSLVIWTVVKTYLSYIRHKKATKGMPMLDNYRLLGGHLHITWINHYSCYLLTAYHYVYGKTFAFMKGARPAVSTVDLDLIKRISVDEANIHTARYAFDSPVPEIEHDSLIGTEGEQFTRIRKSIAPAMTRSKMDHPKVEGFIDKTISKLVSAIDMRIKREKNATGTMIAIDDLVHRSSVDFVMGIFYKQEDKVDYESEKDQLIEDINAGLLGFQSIPFNFNIIFPVFSKLFEILLQFSRLNSTRQMLLDVVNEQTRLSSLAKGSSTKDSSTVSDQTKGTIANESSNSWQNPTDYLYDKLTQNVITKSEYINTSLFFFAAANKTITDAVAVLIYYLALNPDVQRKLRDEIKTKGVESEYLTWCIDEVLRLYPPVPATCTRTTARDVTTDKFTIPKGTIVLVPGYTIHRSVEYWGDDADKFRPERWADRKQLHPMQFIPFGAGRRICVGMHLAQKAMRMMIVALLGRYKMERCEKTAEKLLFASPLFVFLSFDQPIYVTASFLDSC